MKSFKKSGPEVVASNPIPPVADVPVIETVTTVCPAGDVPAAPITAVVASPAQPLFKMPTNPFSTPYVQGEVDKSDFKTPYLSCVQAVGPKSVLHLPGTIVLGENPITKPPTKPNEPTDVLRVLFGSVVKDFVEWLPYDPSPTSPKPRIVQTMDEVFANGGTIEWRNNQRPSWFRRVRCAALIERPQDYQDTGDTFFLLDEERAYAIAMISFQRTSYDAAKTLLTDLSMSLAGDPAKSFYLLKWTRQMKGGNLVWCPSMTRDRSLAPSERLQHRAHSLGGVAETEDDGAL